MPQVSLADFIAQIQSGEALASFPTDTVPALAARPDQSDRIYIAKERAADKPLILMGASWSDLRPYIQGTEAELERWQQVAEQYWPGALTLVLPSSDHVAPAMNPQQTGTLGIRVPNHPLACYLLSQTGPLATTSVNRSGQPPLMQMVAIATQFPQVLTLSDAALASIQTQIPNADVPPSGVPSTVMAWAQNQWTVLRQGAVAIDTLIHPS